MSVGLLLSVLLIAVLNFFVGALLGRQWLIEDIENEARDQRLSARMRAEMRLKLLSKAEDEEVGS